MPRDSLWEFRFSGLQTMHNWTRYGEDNDISFSDPVRGGTSIVKEFFKHALPRGVCRYPQAHTRSVEGRARVGMRVEAAALRCGVRADEVAHFFSSHPLGASRYPVARNVPRCWEIVYFYACKRLFFLFLLLFPTQHLPSIQRFLFQRERIQRI